LAESTGQQIGLRIGLGPTQNVRSQETHQLVVIICMLSDRMISWLFSCYLLPPQSTFTSIQM